MAVSLGGARGDAGREPPLSLLLLLATVAGGFNGFGRTGFGFGLAEAAVVEGDGSGISYYELLEIEKGASEREIKKAYRAMALKYHPDKIGSGASEEEKDAAQERFMRVSKAYDVLSDEMIRNRYNKLLKSGYYEYDEKTWNNFVYDNSPNAPGFSSVDTPWWLDILMTILLATFVLLLPLYMMRKEQLRKQKQEKAMKSSLMKGISSSQKAAADAAAASSAAAVVPKKKPRIREEIEFEDPVIPGASTPVKATSNGSNNTKRTSTARKEWSEEELSILAKAIAKYPGGTPRRWKVITDMLTKRCGNGSVVKTEKQVIQKARQIELSSMGYRKTPAAPAAQQKQKHLPVSSSTDRKQAEVSAPVQEDPVLQWTSKQQTELESALREVRKADCEKKGLDRWEEIAKRVQGKTKRECVQRFKHIRSMIRKNQTKNK